MDKVQFFSFVFDAKLITSLGLDEIDQISSGLIMI